jgi:hypothetical protein
MGTVTFLAPITHLDDHKRLCQDMMARPEDHARSRHDLGIDKERAYYQRMPDGSTGLIVHLEGSGAEEMMQHLANSMDPYDRWFRERIADVHGMNLAEGVPPMPKPAVLLDTAASKNQRSTAFAAPLPADEVDDFWHFTKELRARQPEHKASREQAGITRECVHLGETPQGPMVLAYFEGISSLARSGLLQSESAFDRWFFDRVGRLHHVDFRKVAAQMDNTIALDWSGGKFASVGQQTVSLGHTAR